jgi:hypothetical protein
MPGLLPLTGLTANSALGYLAALGVIEALHTAGHHVELHWTDDFYPHAVLRGIDNPDTLIGALLDDRDRHLCGAVLHHPPDHPFDTLGCSPADLTAWAHRIAALPDDDPDIDQWAALLIEGGLTAQGKAKPTHLDFTAGQVKFLKVVRTIAHTLDETLLNEAVFGPWRYTSTLSTLRYDREGERLAGLRGIPPTSDPRNGVPGADWLAYRGLTFYPLTLAPGRDRARVVTAACDANWNTSAFRWAVWTDPLDHATIRALVTDPDLIGEKPENRITNPHHLHAMGIHTTWQSTILRTGQGYGSFGPPKQTARGAAP